uniref:Protein PTHB1 n=1 Tax=Lygus hesperus TaxID=30085 RepID=A0A0A9W4Y6_LYGHE
MFNFVTGAFCGSSHDMICAQSLNGTLYIVDHDKVICQQCIPRNQFLLPGCLAYCAKTDSLLTCNSALLLMCYSMSSVIKNGSDVISTTSCSTVTIGVAS